MSREKFRNVDESDFGQLTFDDAMTLGDTMTFDNSENVSDDKTDNCRSRSRFDRLPYIDGSRIPVCICVANGKIVYRNSSAKRYLPNLRRGAFMRKFVGDMSFELYNSLCAHPGSAECISVVYTGGSFANSIAACCEIDGVRYIVLMFFKVLQFPGACSANSELVECMLNFAKKVVSERCDLFFSPNEQGHAYRKDIRFSDERVYAGFFRMYFPGMFSPVPAYHVIDTVSRLFKTYSRELGLRVSFACNSISGDRFRCIENHVVFADMCLRIFTVFSEYAHDRDFNVEFIDGENDILMRLKFRPSEERTDVFDVQTFTEFFGENSAKLALDSFCIDYMAKIFEWRINFTQMDQLVTCDVLIPILRGDAFGMLRSSTAEQYDIAFVVSELEEYIAFIAKLSAGGLKSEEEG